MGNKLANAITSTMATWTFIAVFLFLCLLEILLNKHGVVHFDPSTIILNLCLSLIAAIQGSIILIANKQADEKRDKTLETILSIEQMIIDRLGKDDKNH